MPATSLIFVKLTSLYSLQSYKDLVLRAKSNPSQPNRTIKSSLIEIINRHCNIYLFTHLPLNCFISFVRSYLKGYGFSPVWARIRFCALWNRGLELGMFFITCLLSAAVLATVSRDSR